MLTTEFEIVVVIAAFLLGATEGRNIWAWIQSWFVKEETQIYHSLPGVPPQPPPNPPVVHPAGTTGA